MAKRVYTVAQLNRYIKSLLSDDALLSQLRVAGEVSNFKQHTSGHFYFTLKDEYSAVNCVMFRAQASQRANLSFTPQNGMKVVANGHISLYEKTGQYQLYVESMEQGGMGSLQSAFEQLRDRLRLEGLFDESRKRPIPKFVRNIAIITSPTGAAVHDMVRTIKSRNPIVGVVIVPALVQGEAAASDIARAIRDANQWGGADVILLGRGGGSIEDLQAFNEEATARAIAASKIPIISAVGHETDFTISDFAADLRAPTPTAAASMAVYDWFEVFFYVRSLSQRLHRLAQTAISRHRNKLAALAARRCLVKPLEPVYQRQLYVQELAKRMNKQICNALAFYGARLSTQSALLESVSPQALWRRGLAAVRDECGNAVKTVNDVQIGDSVVITVSDGCIKATVYEKTNSGE